MVTSAGFLIVIAMMTAMTGLAISGMHSIQQQLDQVVSVNAEKLRQVAIMRRSNRERIIGLQLMLLLEDPFEIDEVAMQHMGHANHFIAARAKLYDMATSKAEVEALDRIRTASMQASPINDLIRDMAIDEEQEQATSLMLEKLSPAQDQIYAEFSTLAEIYESEAKRSNGSAEEQYEQLFQRMILMLGFVVSLCVLIAYKITRRISSTERALVKHTDELEQLVEDRTADISQEITERERAEYTARKESERLAVTLASIGDGVVTIRPDSTIEYMNPAAEQLTQYEHQHVIGRPVEEVLHLVDRETGLEKNLFTETTVGNSTDEELGDGALKRGDGSLLDIQQTVAEITDSEGVTYGSVVVLRDVSEARALALRLAHEATHDPLTNLVNRREFESRVDTALKRTHIDKVRHTICYLDLDRFKAVNDSCGHAAGDKLLRELGGKVCALLRKGDTFARLGGDEFGLLLDQCPVTKGREIAELVRQAIADYNLVYDDQVFSVGASVGVVEISPEFVDLGTLLSVADAACYMAKEHGRDCVQVYRPTDHDIVQLQGETQWARTIRHALDESRFELHCQPIVGVAAKLEDEKHYELLIRLRREDGELVYPGAFMSAAERYGLLTSIDKWVVDEAFEWLGLHKNALGTSRLSINIAGASLSDASFLQFVTNAFVDSKADPQRVIFEIIETVAVSNMESAIDFMATLGQLGCEFALDDFGRGFSSLGSLRELPVDYLKIDGSFVSGLLESTADEATVKAINEIGHALGKRTVAEFVENDAICERLKELGVDYVQGFGIARPKPINEVFGLDLTKKTIAL